MHEHEVHDEGQAEVLDLNEIMRAFGIEEWINHGVTESIHDEQFQVRIEVQGKQYVLRESPETLVAQESREHCYAFQAYLIGQDIPLAPFRLTPAGKSFVTLGEEDFELQEWREGEPFASSDAREHAWIASAGEMLGRLHQASRHYPGPVYHWPSEVQAGGLTQGWLNFARGKAEQYEVYALASAIATMVEAWEKALPAAMMAIGTGRALPELHIHGDYSALNLRFRGRGVSQVLGLEASRWEKRLLEVAYAVFYFAGLEWRTESSFARPMARRGLDPERASLFLQNYSSVYPAISGEAALLVDALTLVAPIIAVNGPLEDIFYGPTHLDETLIEDAMERLAWATALPAWLTRVRHSFAEMW